MKGIDYKMIGGDGREYGPATLDELRDWAEQGRLTGSTLVWSSESGRWETAGELPELRWSLPSAPSPIDPRPAPSPPRATVPAGFLVRTGAFACDWFVLTFITALLTLPWNGELSEMKRAAFEQARSATPDLAVLMRFWSVAALVHFPISLLYHVGFNTALGGTPGKLVSGLRILGPDGSRLTLCRALARFAGELLSAIPFGAGYLLVAFHPARLALHDLIAGTQVVHHR
ncbi:MAG: RDD family protein [Verrucomicrobiota bacterium]